MRKLGLEFLPVYILLRSSLFTSATGGNLRSKPRICSWSHANQCCTSWCTVKQVSTKNWIRGCGPPNNRKQKSMLVCPLNSSKTFTSWMCCLLFHKAQTRQKWPRSIYLYVEKQLEAPLDVVWRKDCTHGTAELWLYLFGKPTPCLLLWVLRHRGNNGPPLPGDLGLLPAPRDDTRTRNTHNCPKKCIKAS